MKDFFTERHNTYLEYRDYLFSSLEQNLDALITGRKLFNKTIPFNISFLLLQLRHEYYASVKVSGDKLKCLEDRMFCKSLNIIPMENIFPVIKKHKEDIVADDGIDNMQMYPNDDSATHPVNRIKNK